MHPHAQLQNPIMYTVLTGLRETENERQVAGNSFLFQHLSRFDSFPGRGNLDENARLINAHFLVHGNERTSLLDRCLGIKGEARVDLRRNVAGNNLGDFGSKVYGEFVLLVVVCCEVVIVFTDQYTIMATVIVGSSYLDNDDSFQSTWLKCLNQIYHTIITQSIPSH